MLRRLQLGKIYFAGKGGVRVVHYDGSEYRCAEGHQIFLTIWPVKLEGQLIDSRGYEVTVVEDKLRRVASDKSMVLD